MSFYRESTPFQTHYCHAYDKSPDRNLQAVKKRLGHVSIQSTLEYIDESVDSLQDIFGARVDVTAFSKG
ncbi:hypothetical protein CS537_19375 [Yersinia mollaretii]|nr:hypothetical protein CS537_19375 [Yersinia mollaretii]